MHRLRFSFAYAVLGLVLAGSAFALVWEVRTPAPTPHCTGLGSRDPIETAFRFIHAAVERAHPSDGYALATPALRGRTTCAQWAHGHVPVAAFRNVDWNRASYRVEASGDRQMVLKVELATKAAFAPPHDFLLELREVGNLWLVGTWTPA